MLLPSLSNSLAYSSLKIFENPPIDLSVARKSCDTEYEKASNSLFAFSKAIISFNCVSFSVFSSVMSRALAEALIILPAKSFIGDTES